MGRKGCQNCELYWPAEVSANPMGKGFGVAVGLNFCPHCGDFLDDDGDGDA